MSEAAIETEEEENDIILDEGVEDAEAVVEAAPEDPEEVEIGIEGEEQPSSKPVRISGFQKRINRLNAKVDAASSEVESERKRREAAEEEAKLWRMKAQQSVSKPKPEDFDTDAEFEAARERYENDRIAELAAKKAEEQVQQYLEKSQSQTTQASQQQEFDRMSKAHDARAAALKVPDYDEVEDVAIDSLGDDLSRTIVNKIPNSEMLMYYLGKNRARAEEFRTLAVTDPLGCVLELGGLAKQLSVRPKRKPAPDPETQVEGGGEPANSGQFIQGARFE